MKVKMVTILLVIIFIACVPEGDSFTAGAGFPLRQGKRTQVRIVLPST